MPRYYCKVPVPMGDAVQKNMGGPETAHRVATDGTNYILRRDRLPYGRASAS
jgi:hypothetical protein